MISTSEADYWINTKCNQWRLTRVVICVRFTQHVDHPLVVGSKQPYGVFKQQHECCVDHSVGQLVRVRLRRWRQKKSENRVETSPRRPASSSGRVFTWKSSSASSWFWMVGRVLISLSVFMVRITPSALLTHNNTCTQTRMQHTHTGLVRPADWGVFVCEEILQSPQRTLRNTF